MTEKEELKEVTLRFVGCAPDGRLTIGPGVSAKGGEILSAWGRTLCVLDRTVSGLGLQKPFLNSLEEHGVPYEIFDDTEAEPKLETMEKAYEFAKDRGIRAVAGMGGGSALDTAKAVAAALGSGMNVEELFGRFSEAKGSLPLLLMPTTSGTGSEVSPYAVASRDGRKIFIGSPLLYARAALVDPLLTVSAPPRVTAATGMDALSHAVEGMMSAPDPVTCAFAKQSAKLVFEYLPAAVKDGKDLRARYYMSFASVLGMLAYAQGGGLYAHSTSYILTGMLGLPHGVGCGLALPYCVKLNEGYATEELGRIFSPSGDPKDLTEAAGKLRDLQESVGLPSDLSAAGVREEDLDEFSEKLESEYFRPKNPRPMDRELFRRLTRAMYEGNCSDAI